MRARTIHGLPIVSREAEAYAVYDADERRIVAYAPGILYPISKAKALRESSGHKCYYIGFSAAGACLTAQLAHGIRR